MVLINNKIFNEMPFWNSAASKWNVTHVVISKVSTIHAMSASTERGRIDLTHSFPQNLSHHFAG